MVSNVQDTLLVLEGVGLPRWAGRGIVQTLEPIGASVQMKRTVNGHLRDLSYAQFRKYSSKITCTDLRAPALDGIWPGQQVTVSCVAELAYRAAGGEAERDVVSGSERTENGFVFYRPILVMRVVNFKSSIDEWKADIAWEMDLEEI